MTDMDAYDADVLIYAAADDHPLGSIVFRHLFAELDDPTARRAIGSVLLLPELLVKPTRHARDEELKRLDRLLSLIELLPCDRATADLATQLGATYSLRTTDAVHLATAVIGGADRFITNNSRDFTSDIAEIEITYPADLVAPPEPLD